MSESHDASLRFTCPRCRAWLQAPAAEAGVKHRCPNCRSVFLVPKTTQTVAPLVEADDDEEYPLCEGIGQPPPGSPAYRAHFPIVCPLCHTRMLATEDQVGQQMVCPDCGTPVVVPKPAGPPGGKDSPGAGPPRAEEYALYAGQGQPPQSPAQPTDVAMACPVCHTRMQAAPDQVGQEMACPDCGSAVVVPPQRPPVRRPKPPPRPTGEYGVGQPVEPPDYQPVIDARLSRMKPGETLEGSARLGLVRTRPAPPRWAFFSGVFNFPFYAGSWSRWVGLSLAASVVLALLGLAALLLAGPGMGYFSAVPWVIGMLFFAFAGTIGLACAAVASVFLLAILQDTAAGNDEVEDWPSAMFTDWILECVYVLDAFTLSLLPGVAITQALGFHHPASWMAVPAAGFVLFPLVLLSMLEANSALKPFSLPVWRSLFGMGWAWGLFYAEAVVLAVAFFLLSGLALLLPWPLAIPLVAVVLVAALMIYFRLIGRLAWCCAESKRGRS